MDTIKCNTGEMKKSRSFVSDNGLSKENAGDKNIEIVRSLSFSGRDSTNAALKNSSFLLLSNDKNDGVVIAKAVIEDILTEIVDNVVGTKKSVSNRLQIRDEISITFNLSIYILRTKVRNRKKKKPIPPLAVTVAVPRSPWNTKKRKYSPTRKEIVKNTPKLTTNSLKNVARIWERFNSIHICYCTAIYTIRTESSTR